MFSIAEQFSTATKSQLESQLKIINSLASTAVSSAEQVIALNLHTTKATVEKSSSTAKQLMQAKDPQEFIKLSTSQPPSFEGLIAYSSELFSIASKAQAELMRVAGEQVKGAPAVPALKLAPPIVAKEAAAPANEPVAAPKAPAKPVVKAKPVEEEVEAADEAEQKPAAEAAKPTFPTPPTKPAAALMADPNPVALKSVPTVKSKVAGKPADKK